MKDIKREILKQNNRFQQTNKASENEFILWESLFACEGNSRYSSQTKQEHWRSMLQL